jgi:hypothetical protein
MLGMIIFIWSQESCCRRQGLRESWELVKTRFDIEVAYKHNACSHNFLLGYRRLTSTAATTAAGKVSPAPVA